MLMIASTLAVNVSMIGFSFAINSSRKVGHIEDYAKRTAEKAWAAPEVQAHRQEQVRQAQRDGPSQSR